VQRFPKSTGRGMRISVRIERTEVGNCLLFSIPCLVRGGK